MTDDEAAGPVGPPDAALSPRFAGRSTFARLPGREDVPPPAVGTGVAVVGVPFDSGVSYRPGARFGPAHIRASSRLLRPFNPALGIGPFATQQVVDAGDIAVTRSTSARRSPRSRPAPASSRPNGGCARWAATTPSRCRCSASCANATARSPCCTSTPTSTRGTPTSVSRTHGTPFRRASEEGLLDRAHCLHVGIRGPLYSERDLPESADLGFAVVHCADVETLGVAGVISAMRDRLGDRPVYVSVDIDVLDPAFAPGTGTPEAGGMTSRELLAVLHAVALIAAQPMIKV